MRTVDCEDDMDALLEAILRIICGLPEGDRIGFLAKLKNEMCLECGNLDLSCNCRKVSRDA